ncbi:hypothetical protein JCGZ_07185 [Jatropha curcas]|uniref:Uncharacterized protein n=1 Tax=Jatropha curcas TaxID=180498 RepID=A0A067KP89_JATCU|nr:hypothetical protein JCGZ_07185 [Jatropha curcas]
MATLQRSVVFRRQGSSGPVWDEKFLLGEDGVEYRQLRPCQSGSNITDMDCSEPSAAPPVTCPRSLSTPAMKQTYSEASEKGLAVPKSRSGKRNLFLSLLNNNK